MPGHPKWNIQTESLVDFAETALAHLNETLGAVLGGCRDGDRPGSYAKPELRLRDGDGDRYPSYLCISAQERGRCGFYAIWVATEGIMTAAAPRAS